MINAGAVAVPVGDVAIVVAADPGARVLVVALRAARDQALRNGLPWGGPLAEMLAVAEAVEARLQRGSASVPLTVPTLDRQGSAAPSSTGRQDPLDTEAVARQAQVSTRAVRKAAERGRLAGRRTEAGWEFTPEAITQWLASRAIRRPAAASKEHQHHAEGFTAPPAAAGSGRP